VKISKFNTCTHICIWSSDEKLEKYLKNKLWSSMSNVGGRGLRAKVMYTDFNCRRIHYYLDSGIFSVQQTSIRIEIGRREE
jgi:hypothetical protein